MTTEVDKMLLNVLREMMGHHNDDSSFISALIYLISK
ncbi:putative cFA/I fimbrial subunit D, partial [Escherichia coli P0304777.9]